MAASSAISFLPTLQAVQSSLEGGRRQLGLQVAEYTEQLTTTFAALRRKHFPYVAARV